MPVTTVTAVDLLDAPGGGLGVSKFLSQLRMEYVDGDTGQCLLLEPTSPNRTLPIVSSPCRPASREACEATGASWFRRCGMWAGVRVGDARHYTRTPAGSPGEAK